MTRIKAIVFLYHVLSHIKPLNFKLFCALLHNADAALLQDVNVLLINVIWLIVTPKT